MSIENIVMQVLGEGRGVSGSDLLRAIDDEWAAVCVTPQTDQRLQIVVKAAQHEVVVDLVQETPEEPEELAGVRFVNLEGETIAGPRDITLPRGSVEKLRGRCLAEG